METMELLQYLRFREVQKILDELLRQRLIDPVMYDMVLRKYRLTVRMVPVSKCLNFMV